MELTSQERDFKGVQLILANRWARPAILTAGNGRGYVFIYSVSSLSFLFSFLPVPLFRHLFYLFSLSVEDDTKWPTRVDVSLNHKTINSAFWEEGNSDCLSSDCWYTDRSLWVNLNVTNQFVNIQIMLFLDISFDLLRQFLKRRSEFTAASLFCLSMSFIPFSNLPFNLRYNRRGGSYRSTCLTGNILTYSRLNVGKKKVSGMSRERHNHKPQPFSDQRGRPTKPNKHRSNKRTKSTKISSLFPKRSNRNAKRTEKHNKITLGKT